MSRTMSSWEGFETLRRRLDRLFDDFTREGETAGPRWMPTIDVSEDKDKFIIHGEFPGMDKKDIHITLQENVLTISGEKKSQREEKDRSYHLSERAHGHFSRVFSLPSQVDPNNVKAEYKNGVLQVEIPKSPESKAKEIEIQPK
ncbi:MAG: Hsp20/alpha crystallin family protein [Candidatus Zixiibacteriota bacterium]|nr:MAG: Hsp20/alpha crystallin family protein [candidate division Zixibacteria bacterium]